MKWRHGFLDTEAGSSRTTESEAARLGQCSGMTPEEEWLRLSVSASGEPGENGSKREQEPDVGQARHALAPGIRHDHTIWAVGPHGSPPPFDVLIDRVDSGE